MKILGVESSGKMASVALIEDQILLSSISMNTKLTHSETLLPMIDEVLKRANVTITDVDAIAIAAGPGSFTGLRIGAATVKGLGLVTGAPVIPVKTMEGLAFNLAGASGLVVPIMDARRNQVYTGIYKVEDGKVQVLMDQEAMDINDLLDQIQEVNAKQEKVTFLGDGVALFKDVIAEKMGEGIAFAPASQSLQNAASVASLGLLMHQAGQFEDADDFAPIYLRKSQAERVRDEKKHD